MPQTLTDEQKVDVLHRMARAWEAKDWRQCADLFAPQGTLHSMMLEPVVGREVLYERFVTHARPNKQVKLHIHKVGVVAGALVSERTDEITIDGVSRSVPVVGIMEFDGPLISLWREYYDRATLLRAQGRDAEVVVR